MKCTIFLVTFHFYMCAGHALHAHASTRKCHTCAYHTHAPHLLPHAKTKVQSKVQLRGEAAPLHEDVKPTGITVEPRFNEVAGDRPNLFVKSRVRISKTSI